MRMRDGRQVGMIAAATTPTMSAGSDVEIDRLTVSTLKTGK